MAMIRKSVLFIGVVAGLALAGMVLPSDLSAEPKKVTKMPVPAGSTVQMRGKTRFTVGGALGVGGTYSCRCSANGSCSVVQTEGVLQCGKSGDSCTGSCDMSTTTGGGKVMMR